ncbi:hypothetical protein BDQ17DRAFT_1340131 [Cyathus striatus]|nr:hypothetical protein BDQ17DRAFT_1340131 [Cyathus striatus]
MLPVCAPLLFPHLLTFTLGLWLFRHLSLPASGLSVCYLHSNRPLFLLRTLGIRPLAPGSKRSYSTQTTFLPFASPIFVSFLSPFSLSAAA